MNLKSQINILTSTYKEGLYSFVWKSDTELLTEIEKITLSFSLSS